MQVKSHSEPREFAQVARVRCLLVYLPSNPLVSPAESLHWSVCQRPPHAWPRAAMHAAVSRVQTNLNGAAMTATLWCTWV